MLDDRQRRMLLQHVAMFLSGAETVLAGQAVLVGPERQLDAPSGGTLRSQADFAVTVLSSDLDLLHAAIRSYLDPGGIYPELAELLLLQTVAVTDGGTHALFDLLTFGQEEEPYVNRDSVRSALKELLQPDCEPVLVINGNLGTGKSYTERFLRNVSPELSPEVRVATCAMNDTTAGEITASHLAGLVVRRVGGRLARRPRSNEAFQRRAQLLLEWMAEEVAAAGVDVWLVIDGLHHPRLPKDTEHFVQRLLGLMAGKDPRLESMRVVLIDYDTRLMPGTLQHQTLALGPIREQDLRTYFQKRFPEHPEYSWETAAAGVMTQVRNAGQNPMVRLKNAVQEASYVLSETY